MQYQIVSKNTELGKLTNSLKEKLKSNSKFSDSKRKERNEKLESFFKDIPNVQKEFVGQLENIKEGLSKKLTIEEINNLYQTKAELTKLQVQLENFQSQEQVTQIQQTTIPHGMPGSSK